MPPLHIKLGIVKNFIKALVKLTEDPCDSKRKIPRNERAYKYLKEVAFPKISLEKIKEGEVTHIFKFLISVL